VDVSPRAYNFLFQYLLPFQYYRKCSSTEASHEVNVRDRPENEYTRCLQVISTTKTVLENQIFFHVYGYTTLTDNLKKKVSASSSSNQTTDNNNNNFNDVDKQKKRWNNKLSRSQLKEQDLAIANFLICGEEKAKIYKDFNKFGLTVDTLNAISKV